MAILSLLHVLGCHGPDAADEITRVVRGDQDGMRSCVAQALAEKPGLRGTVGLGWTITDGMVTEAHVARNTTGDTRLEACMLKVVRTLRFDPSISAEVAEYPWVISP